MALQYKLAGFTVNQNPVNVNSATGEITLSVQVVTNIIGAPESKFEQIDNTTFLWQPALTPVSQIDALGEAAAEQFIDNNYRNI